MLGTRSRINLAAAGSGQPRSREGYRLDRGRTGKREERGPKWREALCVYVVAFALTFGAVPAAAAPTVWVAPALVRVRPDEAAGTATQLTVYAAKGEGESFQIIVKAPAGGLSNVSVTAPSLGPAQVTLYREHYVYLASGSGDWASNRNKPQGPGYYPDALIPFVNPSTGQDLAGPYDAAPFSLAAGKNQPIWVELAVPRTAAAGEYTGAFTVTSAQGTASVNVTLKVWNFTLPLKPALKSCFMYWPTSDGGQGRGVLQADQELLRHRLNPVSTNASYERSLIDSYGMQSLSLPFWSGADQASGYIAPAPSVSDILAAKAQHQPDLYFYCYSADEISNPALYSGVKAWARAFHAAGVDQLITMVPVPELYDDGSGTGRSAVDDWVLLPKQYDAYRSNVLYVQGKGDDVWSYNCTQQDDYSPKWLLDYAPLNYRIQPGFINQSLGLVGLLYWRVDWWNADPWAGAYPWPYLPGEGLLLYPGAQVGLPGQVVPAMRIKHLRDGVDDYDYVELLKAAGQGAWAVSVARTVGPDWSNWSRDITAVENARLQLGNMLDSLGGGGGGHSLVVTASANPASVASGGSSLLTASATDSEGHSVTSWSWSDNGAGGGFSSTAAQSPSYTAPANTSTSNLTVLLTVTATCGGATPTTGSASTTLTVQGTTTSHTVTVTAAATSTTLSSGGSTTLSATGVCSLGHTGLAWAWSDGGAGGAFSPSATVQNPTYTAPANPSGSPRAITLTLTATCKWTPDWISGSGSVEVTEMPEGGGRFSDIPADHWAFPEIERCAMAGIVTGYEDGTYRPLLSVSRDQMAVFIARAVAGSDDSVPAGPAQPSFPDAPAEHWAYRYIEYAAANHIVTGFTEGEYRPELAVDRGQMAVFLARSIVSPTGDEGLADYISPAQPTFPDVPEDHWARKHVEYVASQGIAGGYPDGTYRPESVCTRDQMAVYIARAFALMG